jgi:large subunit ribosomal protein L9
MKVILQKDVPNLGDAGDIKEVSPGYARNFLLPRKLVIVANESSKRAVEHQRKLIKIKKDKRKKQSEKIAESFAGMELHIPVQVGEEGKLFGSVTAMDIVKKLKEKGFEIDKRKIVIEHPIKQEGEFTVKIKLDEGQAPEIKIIVEKE